MSVVVPRTTPARRLPNVLLSIGLLCSVTGLGFIGCSDPAAEPPEDASPPDTGDLPDQCLPALDADRTIDLVIDTVLTRGRLIVDGAAPQGHPAHPENVGELLFLRPDGELTRRVPIVGPGAEWVVALPPDYYAMEVSLTAGADPTMRAQLVHPGYPMLEPREVDLITPLMRLSGEVTLDGAALPDDYAHPDGGRGALCFTRYGLCMAVVDLPLTGRATWEQRIPAGNYGVRWVRRGHPRMANSPPFVDLWQVQVTGDQSVTFDFASETLGRVGGPLTIDGKTPTGTATVFLVAQDGTRERFPCALIASPDGLAWRADVPIGRYDVVVDSLGDTWVVPDSVVMTGLEVTPGAQSVPLALKTARFVADILVNGKPMPDDGILDGKPRGFLSLCTPTGCRGLGLGEVGPAHVELTTLQGTYSVTLGPPLTSHSEASVQNVLPERGPWTVEENLVLDEDVVWSDDLELVTVRGDLTIDNQPPGGSGRLGVIALSGPTDVRIPVDAATGRFEGTVQPGDYALRYRLDAASPSSEALGLPSRINLPLGTWTKGATSDVLTIDLSTADWQVAFDPKGSGDASADAWPDAAKLAIRCGEALPVTLPWTEPVGYIAAIAAVHVGGQPLDLPAACELDLQLGELRVALGDIASDRSIDLDFVRLSGVVLGLEPALPESFDPPEIRLEPLEVPNATFPVTGGLVVPLAGGGRFDVVVPAGRYEVAVPDWPSPVVPACD